MKSNSWIIVGLAGIVASLSVVIFLLWAPVFEIKQNEITKKEKLATKTENQIPLNSSLDNFKQEGLNFRPLFQTLEPVTSLFKDMNLPEVQEKQEQPLPEPKKNILTDEEWFKIAYPDYYIVYLEQMQDWMIRDGFLKEPEKIEFTSEEKINPFLHKVVDFVLKKGYITETDAKNFRYGLDVVLPDLQKKERNLWQEKISAFLFKIMNIAYAQEEDCFQIGATSPEPGWNGWDECCNCGLICTIFGCIYVPDCGPSGVGCNVQLGCLNLICSYQAAIWDPMTGICGCATQE